MAKLNRTEIRALASKIKKELGGTNSESNEELREQIQKKYFKTPEGKHIKALIDMRREELINNTNFNKALRNMGYDPKPIYVPIEDIENEIILAQIENDDLDSIIEQVKQKFTN